MATSLDRIAASLGRRAGKTALALAILSLAPVAALAADVPVKIKKVTSGDVEGYAPGQASAVTVMCANGVYGTFLLGDGDEASLLASAGESCAVSETAVTPSGYASSTVITVSNDSQYPAIGTSKSFAVGSTGSTVIVANSLMSTASNIRLTVTENLAGVSAADAYRFADVKFRIQVRCAGGYSANKWVTHQASATFDLGTAAAPQSCSASVQGVSPATYPGVYVHSVVPNLFVPAAQFAQFVNVWTIPN